MELMQNCFAHLNLNLQITNLYLLENFSNFYLKKLKKFRRYF